MIRVFLAGHSLLAAAVWAPRAANAADQSGQKPGGDSMLVTVLIYGGTLLGLAFLVFIAYYGYRMFAARAEELRRREQEAAERFEQAMLRQLESGNAAPPGDASARGAIDESKAPAVSAPPITVSAPPDREPAGWRANQEP